MSTNNKQVMNLRERLQQNNNSNSSIVNNSRFDFGRANQEDQMYEKSRRECDEELHKRKDELEKERAHLLRIKEKELTATLDKFNHDFEELRKQILALVNQSLNDAKNRFTAEIRDKRAIETQEELLIKRDIEELLALIQTNLLGLRKENYREYIARIVTTDFDTKKEDIKANIRKLKFQPAVVVSEEKYFSCFRNDLNKMVQLSLTQKKEVEGYKPMAPVGEINMHQNRDRLKRNIP